MIAKASQVGSLPATIKWIGEQNGSLRILDQTRIPTETVYLDCQRVEDVWGAIKRLSVRGAPAIGVAAAYGLCLGARDALADGIDVLRARFDEVGNYLLRSRPTAVNLAWAVQRVTKVVRDAEYQSAVECWQAAFDEATAIHREDSELCRRIGEHGAGLIPEGGGVLTHCNAGALATAGLGTALAVMYVAHEQGKRFHVFADETRPLLQGARLTAFELQQAGIDVTVICDSVAASLMRAGEIQMVVVGADRIAANGDVANKIGTYSAAVAARHHRIPFYVAAPRSTFDLSLSSGEEIPIEERDSDEIRHGFGRRTVPDGVLCRNPAFDVTPAELVTGIVTEAGVLEPVTAMEVSKIFGSGA
jgi:methylthioribose-1-phosphate isomerase